MKYAALTTFLNNQSRDCLDLSFGKIEEIIGDKLPRSAYNHRPWWANRNDGNGAQCRAWQDAGWVTRNVDLDDEHVTFMWIGSEDGDAGSSTSPTNGIKKLTIAEAREGLAAMFDVDPDRIEINIRG